MDLLDSILRSANAERYIEAFERSNIEASTLPLLTDEDLQIIGVDNSDSRNEILKKFATLQIPSETKIDRTVTDEYAELVLSQVSHQLYLHCASLSYAIQRKDLVICNIKLHEASQCLLNCITALEQEVNRYEHKFQAVKARNHRKRRTFIIAGATAVALFVIGGFIISRSFK